MILCGCPGLVRLLSPGDLAAGLGAGDLVDVVVHGDCLEVLGRLPSSVADMVFFDPPYFLQLPKGKRLVRWGVRTAVESPEERWDLFSSWEEYDRFVESVLAGVRRVMKPCSTIWAIGTYHNIYRIGKIMQDLGFWILNDVIWFKTNPMPNWLGVRLANSTETLIWAVKEKSCRRHTFNRDAAREYSERDWGRRLGYNVWRIPLCSGRERLRDEKGRRLHPTQKPEQLLERVIRISTKPGDLILDPMAGTGTTGVVAMRLGRRFLLIEREEKYVKAILERLSKPSNFTE